MKFIVLIFENVRRNVIRTSLTALGTIVLVFVVTLVWSILEFLQGVTTEKTSNIKAIVSERWRLPSQMPISYRSSLIEAAARNPEDTRPTDYMSWTFYGFSIDKENRSFANGGFAFCMEPEKLLTMMDELDSLPADKAVAFREVVEKLKQNQQGIVMGKQVLAKLNKRVGERLMLYGLNYKELDLEVEIVGEFPAGRYDSSTVINRDYFDRALFDAYPLAHGGKAHELAEKSLNLVWVKVPDTTAFTNVAQQISESPFYASPAVKVETAASGIGTFLEAYRDLIWGMRYLLAPSIIVTLALVISNAISISVRERRMEFAVMKVLGYQPLHILIMVLGEALAIGALSGAISAGLTYYIVNYVLGGLKFPIAFFPAFMVSDSAPIWGIGIGAGAALAGSFMPAWQACRVKVAEVFGRVA